MLSIGAKATAKNFIIDSVAKSNDALVVLDIGASNALRAPANFALPTTATSAASFRIWNPPPNRVEFTAYVTLAADFSLPAEGEMTASLTLTPKKPIPPLGIYIPTS